MAEPDAQLQELLAREKQTEAVLTAERQRNAALIAQHASLTAELEAARAAAQAAQSTTETGAASTAAVGDKRKAAQSAAATGAARTTAIGAAAGTCPCWTRVCLAAPSGGTAQAQVGRDDGSPREPTCKQPCQ